MSGKGHVGHSEEEAEYVRRMAARLRKVKHEKGLTNGTMARRLGVTENTVQSWTTAKGKPIAPGACNLARICTAYHVDPAWLLGLKG